MAYEPREGSGALFKNDRKSDPAQPDYTGNCVVDGKVLRLAAWIKEGKQGKFMSISIKPDEPRPQAKADPRPIAREESRQLREYRDGPDTSDIPF